MQWPVILAILVLVVQVVLGGGGGEFPGRGVTCDFETPCPWTYNRTSGGPKSRGFQIIKAEGLNKTALATLGPVPLADADNNTNGSYLLLRTVTGDMEFQLKSTTFTGSINTCRLEAYLYMVNMSKGVVKLVAEVEARTSWFIDEEHGNNESQWLRYSVKVGPIVQDFSLLLEFLPPPLRDSLVAIDNLRLVGCFPEEKKTPESCSAQQYECVDEGECVDRSAVCDIVRNCPHGDDEEQNCDELPDYSRCDFQEDWCGWTQPNHQALAWTLHKGETPTPYTGPHFDNTYANETGYYALVNMAGTGVEKQMGASAILQSATFNPPPCYHNNVSNAYYNSCQIRFYYHMFGPHAGSLSLSLVEVTPQEKRTVSLWWTYGNRGDNWWRNKVSLPNITHRYYVQFEARKGITARSDVALDDISFSPECFGIGVPPNESCDYCYGCIPFSNPVHPTFINKTLYALGTCGAEGRLGPTQENCTQVYEGSDTRVTVLENAPFEGIQEWVVPEDGFYTLIAKGASGSKGFNSNGEASRGAVARMIVELQKGQHIYALVGQEGGHSAKHNHLHEYKSTSKLVIHDVKNMKIVSGGGGGGGGTFIFLLNKEMEPQPLLVAAGGGGLARTTQEEETRICHGHGVNVTRQAITGQAYGDQAAGAGGGWRDAGGEMREVNGRDLLNGAQGGHGCNHQMKNSNNFPGGFGGGGGGCLAGGGGGGWIGGNAWSSESSSGEGGFSFLGPGLQGKVLEGAHSGPGAVVIIPAQPGCLCDYRCAALDENRHQIQCLCPVNWYLADDNTSCILKPVSASWSHVIYLVALIAIVFFLLVIISMVCFLLYNHYQRKRAAARRHLMLTGPDVQLNRLREASDSMMTEYNPNYEFGGGTYTIRDLKDIPREQLRLIRALGQGAFGEVYQGFFRHRPGDAVEMPVAVKTLPELSTNQAENDFLMEALIMSKFSHPNIVHFIGVCFDKHPRFIVLELLAGGDLKTFLRESRPKPVSKQVVPIQGTNIHYIMNFGTERPSSLSMRDLLLCSIDVAKGCKYMEENRFIHRDIAARNCLLTTKGPGRVVKIADFGMARDIYRADYYRKGGKAMLPIKWMPPEAFLDGIFTSKTDVWSFGVLLWEVMSLGYMPYTGCGNRDVMQLVTSGGRLEPPNNCPGPLYGIMMQCWHPNPDERPNFSTILERLGYCSQDPDVMNAPLPVFVRPPSAERDATIMRPPASENSCLQIQRAADYLVPLHGPDVPSSPSSSSVDKLLGGTVDWETSFVLPESRSTQPLLQEEDPDNAVGKDPHTTTTSTSTSTSSTNTPASTANMIFTATTESTPTTNSGSPGTHLTTATNPQTCQSTQSTTVTTAEGKAPAPATQVNHLGSKRSNNSLKGSLSLDPAALGSRPPLSYANVSVTAQPASAPPDTSIAMPPPPPPFAAMVVGPPPPARHDSEISC